MTIALNPYIMVNCFSIYLFLQTIQIKRPWNKFRV